MARRKPTSLRIRSFQVGFGDCFLLTFRYARSERHVLIDFGSTGRPKRSRSMDQIAHQIKEVCSGKLHGVVATHRHKDHISGFATKKNRKGAGNIIAACSPSVVVQPWTEDPDAATDATAPTRRYGRGSRGLVTGLASMQDLAGAIARLAPGLSGASKGLREAIGFIGETNLPNLSAVRNLKRMAKKGRPAYVYFGSRSGLERVLPGVEIRVLGPPTLRQTEAIRKQRSRDESEFWHLQAVGLEGAQPLYAGGRPRPLFPRAGRYRSPPVWARWLVGRLKDMSADSLLELVRALDHQMNNTSVILLFKVGNMSVLFPGDAQIENWSYALSQDHVKKLLKGVNVYKVGHHGSLNATPKSLWNLFEKRGSSSATRMHSVVSTMGGKHGHRSRNTEVPRKTLVDALKDETHYFSTQEIRGRVTNYRDIEVDFRKHTVTKVGARRRGR